MAAARDDVTFLFVNQGERRTAIEGYLNNEKLTLSNVLLDWRMDVPRHYATPGLPVTLFIGSGVMDPPVSTWFGDWYLELPVKMVPLCFIPCSGLRTYKMKIPKKPSGPYDIPMQALIGWELSNLCVVGVE